MKDCHVPDDLLIKRAAKGSVEAFNEIALMYRDKIYAVCLMVTKNKEDAEDASQEVLIKIFNKLKDYKFESSFGTWVYSIAKNTALDFLRKVKPTVNGDDLFDTLPCDNSVYAAPEKSALDNELRSRLIDAINSLPEDRRDVVILREIEGYSYSEIAQIKGITEGTVKSKLSRAREKLREMLMPYIKR